jgi:hypothetical protein
MSNQALSAMEGHPEIETTTGTYFTSSSTIVIRTNRRLDLSLITNEIAAYIEETPIRESIVHVPSLHTTAGLMLNIAKGVCSPT